MQVRTKVEKSAAAGGRRLLAFGVWPAFVRWHGAGWRLFAFGFGVVGCMVGVFSPLV